MTAQLLTSELSILLQESKRKNPELRASAEKSLTDLNALPRTSEAQIVADLRSRPAFVNPFLIACRTRNPKFAGNAVSCLQRLIVADALPKHTLSDVLEALRETSSLALDIQLKVLQALPSLLQNYDDSLTGPLLIATFQICFLLHSNKTAVVTNLAAAALQQLINSTFEKAASSEASTNQDGGKTEVSVGDSTIAIGGPRLDAYRIFDDVCLITEGHKPKYIQGATLGQSFGFELIESILANHVSALKEWPEAIHIVRIRLIPFVTRILSEKSSFVITIRCMRLVDLMLRSLLDQLTTECEVILSLLNHMLDPDAAPLWKRATCLEIYRNLHSDADRIRTIYATFDREEERRNIIKDHLGVIVRLASEKPALIGLGQQSSVPTAPIDESGEQAAMQEGGLVGSIAVSVSGPDINTPGISNRWSDLKTPCLEQFDKLEPLPIPATYIYKLALTCLTMFEEGIARFLLPFTVPREKKTKRRPAKGDNLNQKANSVEGDRPAPEDASKQRKAKVLINPLTLQDHPMGIEISISAEMVDECWPALLAASSTFLNAAMDSENFHALIRSFQKFTQIAGLLGLSTPRDAFLTTLGKHALPTSKAVKQTSTTALNGAEGMITEPSTQASQDSSPASTVPSIKPPLKRQQTATLTTPVLSSRHLLCLRALLNLGIALGPLLHNSWPIILETLQQADLLMSSASSTIRRPRSRENPDSVEGDDEGEDRGLEFTAAETASSRLFESTRDFEYDAFKEVLQSLCNLLHDNSEHESISPTSSTLSPINPTRKHQKLRSISGTTADGASASHDKVFVLGKLKQIIQCNVPRLAQTDNAHSGWNLLCTSLMTVLSSGSNDLNVRLAATAALNDMLVLTAVSKIPELSANIDDIRARSLNALLSELNGLHMQPNHQSRLSLQCELEIHRMALDALKAILEQCGESLKNGWIDVFRIILSTFHERTDTSSSTDGTLQPRSPALVRAAFGSVELICSDFLSSVPISCFLQLLDTLYRFASQMYDLNISLTTSTFFQTISEYALRDNNKLSVEDVDSQALPAPGACKGSDHNEHCVDFLWLCLLNFLVELSTDSRPEARHSIIHTTFRILSAQTGRLLVNSVPNIYSIVISPMISNNQMAFDGVRRGEAEDDKIRLSAWSKSACLIIDGITKLVVQWFDSFGVQYITLKMLHELLGQLDQLLRRKELFVSKATFGGIRRVLAEFDEQPELVAPVLTVAWELWGRYNPVDHNGSSETLQDNNEALLAYLFCLGQLLRLSGRRLKQEDAELVLLQLLTSVRRASASVYSSDLDTITPVQKAALESIKMLPRVSDDYDLQLMGFMKKIINLAYHPRQGDESSHSSYVALSKASMTLLDSFILDRIQINSIKPDSRLPSIALSALQEPILLKYRWHRPGREPSTWKKATSTAISIVSSTASLLDNSSKAGRAFWAEAVLIVTGIITADCTPCSNSTKIPEDETFDIHAFKTINPLLVSALGSETLPDAPRTQYCSALFTNSLVHDPHPDDLALPGQPLLSGLSSDHFGQVKPLPPTPRSRISYLMLDTLLALVAAPIKEHTGATKHQSNDNHIRLARSAAPFLILRCALTLKTYVYDNPLRGYMPLPSSQRREMETVLRKVVELRAEPESARGWTGGPVVSPADEAEAEGQVGIEAATEGENSAKSLLGASNEFGGQKWHLLMLYPLLLKALKAARRDERMKSVIQGVLEEVGSAWEDG